MKICEVCGMEEEMGSGEDGALQSGILHICENCRTDRKIISVVSSKQE